jgi:tetratricopeptide (TPR) repeat protein
MAELNHAVLLMDWGRIDIAVGMYEELLGRFREVGSGEGAGLTLLNMGEAAFLQGNDAEAATRFDEARAAFAEIGFRAHVGHATQGLAAVAARAGDAVRAAGTGRRRAGGGWRLARRLQPGDGCRCGEGRPRGAR